MQHHSEFCLCGSCKPATPEDKCAAVGCEICNPKIARIEKLPTPREQVLDAMIKEWLVNHENGIAVDPQSAIYPDITKLQPAFKQIMGRKAVG